MIAGLVLLGLVVIFMLAVRGVPPDKRAEVIRAVAEVVRAFRRGPRV